MSCFSPAHIPHPRAKKSEGLRLIVPCGRCLGCLLKRGREWAARCMHEELSWDTSYFLTLTYRDEELHQYGTHPSLNPPDVQRFFKRLRKAGFKFRYLYCGEYGDEFGRPHYHCILFGVEFDDLKLRSSQGGHNFYTSVKLENFWTHGDCLIGFATPETVSYTCGYTIKKLYGPDATLFYAHRGQYPPFIRMSKGIGKSYIENYAGSVASRDGVYLNEQQVAVPRYYRKYLEKRFRSQPLTADQDPTLASDLRLQAAVVHLDEMKPDRLFAKQSVAVAQFLQNANSRVF